jgi:hypothetical protein
MTFVDALEETLHAAKRDKSLKAKATLPSLNWETGGARRAQIEEGRRQTR